MSSIGWIKLTGKHNGKPLYINVASIQYVFVDDDGDTGLSNTALEDSDSWMVVQETPEQVMALILGVSVTTVRDRKWTPIGDDTGNDHA